MRQAQPPRQETPSPSAAPATKGARRIWAIIAAFAVVVGLPGSIFAIWPRMTISTNGPFDEANAYSESFTATNTSFVPLRGFNIAIGFCDIKTATDDFTVINNCVNDQHLPHMLIGDPNWNAPILARDEPFTITLTDEITTPTEKYRTLHPRVISGWKTISALKGANAVVIATYRPWIIPCWSWISEWVCVKRARFIAEEQPNGKVMWRSVPLSWMPQRTDD